MATATFGRSAPVAMDVAMAFAVSWKPFVKSKTSAVATTTTTMTDAFMYGASRDGSLKRRSLRVVIVGPHTGSVGPGGRPGDAGPATGSGGWVIYGGRSACR
jgi:hypothetical protein